MLVRLRAARRQARLTQAEVAEALGWPLAHVTRCEAGTYRIDVIEFSDLAALYGKPLAHFVELPRSRHPPGS